MCCKIPAQFSNSHPTEIKRVKALEIARNSDQGFEVDGKKYFNYEQDKKQSKSTNSNKASKELVKCINYKNCGLYRGLNYTADALYRNITIVRQKTNNSSKVPLLKYSMIKLFLHL